MKITRIRLEQFKQFRKPVEITGLTDGINLFTGPNEAGKSTIVAAVRAAFFERHRSSSVDTCGHGATRLHRRRWNSTSPLRAFPIA